MNINLQLKKFKNKCIDLVRAELQLDSIEENILYKQIYIEDNIFKAKIIIFDNLNENNKKYVVFEIKTFKINEKYQITLASVSEEEMLLMERNLELLRDFMKIKAKVKNECEIITMQRK
jgi:hypothetical protein